MLRAQIRGQASYRTSFALDLLGNALTPVFELFALFAFFRITHTLGGFTAHQVLAMYGLSATAFALSDLAVGNIERLRQYVRAGTFDAVLVRPLSTLWQLVALDFSTRRVSRVAVALIVFVVALSGLPIDWTPQRVALVAVTPVAAAVFFSSVFVMTATVAFWWIDSGELANAFTYAGRDFTSYPVTVYSGLFRWLFAYSLGFAFVVYYPCVALFGVSDPLGLPAWVAWSSPLVAMLAASLATAVWRFGVRHYRSTGS